MEIVSKSSMGLHHVSRKWRDQIQRSPERTKVWIEPNKHRRVAVVYYLCRNGQLEHPHFVEVTLSCPEGLYLRDVIDRLNSLRGNGMAALYSWSSKRSYKNGFVWHDLSDNDFIYPVHGQEYILKGSELFDSGNKSDESPSSISKKSSSSETLKSVDQYELLSVNRNSRTNQSWTTIDLHEYKVYSGESTAARIAANASTQTECNNELESESYHDNEISELSRNEISSPPSDSSTETLESLMKSDGKLILRSGTDNEHVDINPTVGSKLKASSVLMQLISCGSISFRNCGPGKQNPGFSLGSKYKHKMLPRGEGVDDRVDKSLGEETGENDVVLGGSEKVNGMEDKEYFSGSLMETKKDEFPALKRSNSYNANG
ncbi:hypothetical protein M8C21_001023 [Ambrosia artemisiifolia]|uniref:SOSEKI DIX-like domain-containing protein n=1 Tax=Ambrosia artemisiifolia TaxID=4212 RepID=A0AAD5GGH7_AMBAR|nr:hypothetical protein M8C21_001023 [Ambrosia artemisiifolia]